MFGGLFQSRTSSVGRRPSIARYFFGVFFLGIARTHAVARGGLTVVFHPLTAVRKRCLFLF